MLSMLSCVVAQTLLLAAGPDVKVQTLAGQTVVGTLENLSTEQLVVVTSANTVSLPLSGVVDLAPAAKPRPTEARPGAWIEFTDGTQLLAQDYRVERGEMRAVLIGADVVTSPVKLVVETLQSRMPPSSWELSERSCIGHSGQGVAGERSSGGFGSSSNWVTEIGPWRCVVPRQSAPVSPPPMITTCLPAAIAARA